MGQNFITGRTEIVIDGVRRELACDMNAIDALYRSCGEEWAQWLVVRFFGEMIDIGGGQKVRALQQIPKGEIGLALFALLAGDRRRDSRHDTVDALLESLGDEGLTEAQELMALSVIPAFEIPGKGLGRKRRAQKSRERGKKQSAWSWRQILEMAHGPLGLKPHEFWDITLVEWQTLISGYEERQRILNRQNAWIVSHLLVAAGCEADKVTIPKLLGEEPRRRTREAGVRVDGNTSAENQQATIDQIWERFQEQARRRKERVVEIGEEAVKAEETAALEKERLKAQRRDRRGGR